MLTKLRLYTRAITLFNAYLLLSVTACSSVDVSRSYPDDNIDTKLVNLTARQETKQIADAASLVEASFIAAQSSNLDYFSPYSWRQVNTDIRNMRSIVLKFEPAAQGMLGGPSQAKVMAAIDQAQASIARAERQKTAVKDYFSKVFTATEFLKPHINTLWQRDVDRINADLTASIIEFEADPSLKQHQQTRASLQMRLHRLEVDIVRDRYYDPLHNQLKQFDSQLIPRSYAKIKYQLQLLDNQIVDAPRDTQQREQAIALVNKEIQRTRHVVADVNWINDLDKVQRESIVLHYRKAIERLSMTILNQDLSDLSYRRQVTEFENALVAKLQQEQLLPATTTPPQVAPSHAAPTNANGISPDSRNDIDSMMNEAPLPKKRRAHR